MTFPSLHLSPHFFLFLYLTLPLLSAPHREDLVVISTEGGLLSPTMLSLSVSLSSCSSDLCTVKEMCVCVCVFMLLRYFLCLPLSFYFRSFPELPFFSQISVTHPPSFPFPFSLTRTLLSLSPSPQKNPIPLVAMGSGCHAAAGFSHGPRVYACLL